jgi:ubiquinone/menaquinone biosynthesis C-methylase UbiE
MSRSVNGFNRVALIYDMLAHIVFGRALWAAQHAFLPAIPPASNVLMLGGGTGRQLRALLEINHACCVWYIEASSAMLNQAKRALKSEQQQRVHFVHGTEANIPGDVVYDVVITSFFLDLFTDRALEDVMAKGDGALRTGGLWLVTDFVDSGKWWQKRLLDVMYAFFRITCNVEAKQLPSWQQIFERYRYSEIRSRLSYGTFIKSLLLRKGRISV